MKKNFILILLGLAFCTQILAQEKEKIAIKKTCIEEIEAYNNLDYDSWATYHIQNEDEHVSWNNPDGTFGHKSGWKIMSTEMKSYMQSKQKEDVKITTENFTCVINGNMAITSFTLFSQKSGHPPVRKLEFRTLIKRNRQWKLLSIQVYIDHTPAK